MCLDENSEVEEQSVLGVTAGVAAADMVIVKRRTKRHTGRDEIVQTNTGSENARNSSVV